MKAQATRFKRAEDSKWEDGIMIGTDADESMLIVDTNGKAVPVPLYDFRLTPEEGCFTLETPNKAPEPPRAIDSYQDSWRDGGPDNPKDERI